MTWLSNTIYVWGWLTAISTIFLALFKNKQSNTWFRVVIKIANCFSVIKHNVKQDATKKKK